MVPYRLKSVLAALLLYGVCSICLLGCSSTPGSQQPKVAMHVDAVLEFAMEYPQLWQKEILVDWRSDEGSVHWAQPGFTKETGVKLTVYSRRKPADEEPAQVLESTLKSAHPGFEISARGVFELPAGAAQHLLGYTPQRNYAGYLLQTGKREYLIEFTAPAEDFDTYRGTLDEILESFIILNADETTHAD